MHVISSFHCHFIRPYPCIHPPRSPVSPHSVSTCLKRLMTARLADCAHSLSGSGSGQWSCPTPPWPFPRSNEPTLCQVTWAQSASRSVISLPRQVENA
eukprot:366244-Chlamydomonas_euryale.AAC.11